MKTKYLLLLGILLPSLLLLTQGASTASFNEDLEPLKDGEIFYEIRFLTSNDKGNVVKEVIQDAEVMKFRREKDKRFDKVDHLLDRSSGVKVKLKEYQ